MPVLIVSLESVYTLPNTTMKLCINTLIIINLISFFSSAKAIEPLYSCDASNPSTKGFPFCDAKLPIPQRVEDLVSRLTLAEKISQLGNNASDIPRLNVSAYQWWVEGLHGVSRHGKGVHFYDGSIHSATMFPQVILTAASFDQNLWFRIGQAIATEIRAMYNEGQATGLTIWTPNINILRDPRWGRGQETPGEDPLLTSKYAVSFVRGIQGDSFEGGLLKDGHLMTSACCKHFTAHDLDNWKRFNRYTFDAKVSKQDLADTFQPPFQACIQQGQASGLMCAYNLVNGIPSCADYDLLTETAREKWGFQGYIVSDCDAVSLLKDNQSYAQTPQDAVADVLKAGMDVNCGGYLRKYSESAIQEKKITEAEVDKALTNLFSVRMRLGLFNGNPKSGPFGLIGPKQVCSVEHQDLALEAARSGIVLLKNSAELLPLSKAKTASLAVIGPNANTTWTLLGNYEGYPCKNITLLQGLQGYIKNTMFQQGCNFVNCTSAAIDQAVDIAKQADEVVLIMGLDQTIEREKLDRLEVGLPGSQQNLIMAVAQAAKKPVILVLLSGGPIDISFAINETKIGSILWAGYPGEAGGIALAQVVFGDHNPGGKLPTAWYANDYVATPMTDMRIRPDPKLGYPGRTYRFYRGKKVFEFGYGLSYSYYSYEFALVPKNKIVLNLLLSKRVVRSSNSVGYISVSAVGTKVCQKATFSAMVGVKNIGKMAGKHPVLLFVRPEKLTNESPIKQLIGFQTVNLNIGERVEIKFVINPCEHFSRASQDGSMVIDDGPRYLIVGDKEYKINFSIL